LQGIKDKESFVAGHVSRGMQEKISASLRERMPRRYLELESQRLASLVTEWLDYEATRIEFEVANTEVKRTVPIAGLTFDLRLDRIDRLRDNSLLVIDYKSGAVSPKSWELPRPDDVQLPLYASYAVEKGEALGGLVFAKVQSGEPAFAGLVGDARTTLKSDLSNSSNLVRNNSLAESLIDWKQYIEQLAKDFLAGRAEVDPREYPKTCERCGLQTLCRIQESQALLEEEDDSESSEGDSDE
jgi:ATP-dependent helicase/DNAse subunit B